MRPLLFCLLFLALGAAGWSASSSFDRAGFIWLDTTTTDTTPTTTTTPTDSTPTGTTTITSTDTTPTTTITSTDTTPTITTPTTTVINPPSFANVPQNVSVEANGPSGSVVNYTAPTAVDDQGGPLPVTCSPGPGSTFALGDSTVTCTATDSGGNQGQAAFTVSVRDTTPPTLVVPAPHSVFATSALGISDSDPAVIAFVGAARATDIVDPAPVVGSDLHSFLPVGATVIRFFARDFSGNDTTRDVVLTVLPQPPANTPPLAPPAVRQPPANVAALGVAPLDGALRLTWQPACADHVVVTRSNSDGSAEQVVYSGNGSSYTDQGLENGVEYRYVVRCVDAAGNRSAGVAIVAVPRRNMLRSPKDGAQLTKPPRLVWSSEAQADYYNLQLLRNGVRIFTAWPRKTSLTLQKTWKYEGRRYTLAAGRYEWYVWPGIGPRKDANYGILLGARSFRISR
jgi:HYR domain